jgi:hypothetical protein
MRWIDRAGVPRDPDGGTSRTGQGMRPQTHFVYDLYHVGDFSLRGVCLHYDEHDLVLLTHDLAPRKTPKQWTDLSRLEETSDRMVAVGAEIAPAFP